LSFSCYLSVFFTPVIDGVLKLKKTLSVTPKDVETIVTASIQVEKEKLEEKIKEITEDQTKITGVKEEVKQNLIKEIRKEEEEMVEKAHTLVTAFGEWAATTTNLELIGTEVAVFSFERGYAGTVDAIARSTDDGRIIFIEW
jgi:hypothetical protein